VEGGLLLCLLTFGIGIVFPGELIKDDICYAQVVLTFCAAMKLFSALATLAVASVASAHGGAWKYSVGDLDFAPYVLYFIIRGLPFTYLLHSYAWWQPDIPQVSIQRRWPSRYPIYDPLYENMACNDDGTPTSPSLYATIEAGGVLNGHYDKDFLLPGEVYPTETWGHEWGPMFVYLAACGDSCEDLNLRGPIWFKIHELGLLNGTWVTGHWGQTDLNAGAPFAMPIPKSLKPGKYLLRHEVIAIHNEPRQIYPECVQIEVTGSGTAVPSSDWELVSFPGAYSISGMYRQYFCVIRADDLTSDPGLNLTTYGFWIEHANDTVSPALTSFIVHIDII